jgi:hypothetical protein
MRKITLLLSVLAWIVLFGCGGGGGGGGGTSDTGTTIIYSSDYTNRDLTKVYTFKETVVDTTDVTNPQTTINSIIYSYDQNVATIPGKYNYTGPISGPYIVETMEYNGVDKGFTYFGSSRSIITDDSILFTNIDHSDSSGVIPPDWTVGTVYTESTIEDLFNSTSGSKVGTRTTEHTLKALGVENVTVPADTFRAAKTQESTTRTITVGSVTETITTTSLSWYSKDIALVKIVANTTDVFNDGSSTETSTYTVTDELTKRE